jgi:RNA polymerase sigma factor (sigma-70 family)
MPYPQDDAGFDQFVRAEIGNLVNHVKRAGAARPEAEDAVQEALAEAYARWSTIRFPRRWVQSASLRHHQRTRMRDRKWLDREAKAESGTASAAAPILRDEEEAAVLRAIAQLPTRQGEVFALSYDGYRTAEIAAILGLTEAAVRSHLRYARAALRRGGINDGDLLDPEGGAA